MCTVTLNFCTVYILKQLPTNQPLESCVNWPVPASAYLAEDSADKAAALGAESKACVHKRPEEHGEDGEHLLDDVARLPTHLPAGLSQGVAVSSHHGGEKDGAEDCGEDWNTQF
ncbi:hypothetical protein PoB_003977400 [Plakobranchus ocellatus]|uniref:Uncharacterized protein n=1 Tax=Plakobranchus ocellatus TaxID=259542 RepID=A0AAV4B3M6_9GAST|nr:hypothetical protein PoB_003977400 [Plakobranchus ocellatus]